MKPLDQRWHLIKNGFYIPILHAVLYYATKDWFLSSIIAIKLYPANYFCQFAHYYNYRNISPQYNFVKQFIRFTDTGHIISFVYYFYPRALPIAHNVHFIITVGYWSGKWVLNVKDADEIKRDDIIDWFTSGWTYFTHVAPYMLIVQELRSKDNPIYFTSTDLYLTFAWIYGWLFFIYLPWRFITGDPVYSVLSDETPIKTKLVFILLIHGIVFLSNGFGLLY